MKLNSESVSGAGVLPPTQGCYGQQAGTSPAPHPQGTPTHPQDPVNLRQPWPPRHGTLGSCAQGRACPSPWHTDVTALLETRSPPGSTGSPTLVGKDPIYNAATAPLPLISPFLQPPNQELTKNRAPREVQEGGSPPAPVKGEELGEGTVTCPTDQGCQGTGRQPSTGEKACPSRQWATWGASLNVLEVLGSSRPTTGKHRASSSREKPAHWGRSGGRQGEELSCLPSFLPCPHGTKRSIPGHPLCHFTQAEVGKDTGQTLHPH